MLVNGVLGLAGQIIGLFGQRGQAQQEQLKAVSDRLQRTWVDELIVLYWFWPSVAAQLGWAEPLAVQIQQIKDSPELFAIQLGITGAVFGLNKIAGKR